MIVFSISFERLELINGFARRQGGTTEEMEEIIDKYFARSTQSARSNYAINTSLPSGSW